MVAIKRDSGISISELDFDNLVNKFSLIIRDGKPLQKINDYIILSRLINTIYYSELFKIERYKRFYRLYAPNYANLAIKALEALPRKGSYFYSSIYDFYFGGSLNNTSFYSVLREKGKAS